VRTIDAFCGQAGVNGAIGVGDAAASSEAVRAVLADPDKRRLTDPLWQSTEVVRSLPSRLIRIEGWWALAALPLTSAPVITLARTEAGWRTLEFGIVTERFKAPAVVVSPRDSLVVRVRLRSVDGTRVRLVLASCRGGEGPALPEACPPFTGASL